MTGPGESGRDGPGRAGFTAGPVRRPRAAPNRIAQWSLACLLGTWLPTACAPMATRPGPVPHATKPATSRNWLSQNERGELVLPREVQIHLTAHDRAPHLDLVDGAGQARRIEDTRFLPTTIPGPVTIGDRLHQGTLVVEAHPQGGVLASVTLPLETYIAGVVAAELPIWSAEPAELEAQAIAARTFAAAAMAKRRKDGAPARLTDGVLDQAYRGTYDGRRSNGARNVAAKLRAAVDKTAGMVVVRGERLEETRYHAACGGHTANFADVFTSEVERYGARGPTGRPCASCSARARNEHATGQPAATRPLSWVVKLDAKDLATLGRKLQLGGPLHRIEAARSDSAGRWLDVRLISDAPGAQPVTVRFDAVRSALGYSRIKGAVIDALAPAAGHPIPAGSTLTLQGRGRGHGVGLCQEGARDYARAGHSATAILQHYYPGTTIRRVSATDLP